MRTIEFCIFVTSPARALTYIDNVTMNELAFQTPEPTSLAMLGVACPLLGRRRKGR